MKKIGFTLVIVGIASFLWAFVQSKKTPAPPNIILLIGDGMGLSQMSSAFFLKDNPNFERMPVVGLSKTASSKEKITDSAAGATAFACGQKTYNGAIGVNDAGDSIPTLVELLSLKGYQSGLIATSSITHATPASFYAHVPSRQMEEEIAEYLLKSQVDFFAGGGLDFFTKRKDDKQLTNGSSFTIKTDSLVPMTDVDGPLGYLLAGGGMPKMEKGRGDFLSRATALAFDFFKKEETPFFLMVEGSQIDWGGHANDGEYVVQEVLDFDAMLGVVLDYAEKDGNTLVVVTADHETGGFTLASEQKKIPFKGLQSNYENIRYDFTTFGHSATMVPVLAYGSGAQNFGGIYENTAIFDKIMQITQGKK
jgi:alkaline phosphatase